MTERDVSSPAAPARHLEQDVATHRVGPRSRAFSRVSGMALEKQREEASVTIHDSSTSPRMHACDGADVLVTADGCTHLLASAASASPHGFRFFLVVVTVQGRNAAVARRRTVQ